MATILQTEKNSTLNTTEEIFDYSMYCGANNCPQTPLPKSGSTTIESSVYWLCGSLDILIILSILITLFFMDDIKEDSNDEKIKPSLSIGKKTLIKVLITEVVI